MYHWSFLSLGRQAEEAHLHLQGAGAVALSETASRHDLSSLQCCGRIHGEFVSTVFEGVFDVDAHARQAAGGLPLKKAIEGSERVIQQ